ncbi:MAG: class II glutamine amidotransferase [archaeon]|jgi:glutamate synthase domain-containing protein 1
MCGIIGAAYKEKKNIGKSLVEMAKTLQHRGTDGAGFAIYGGLELNKNEYMITVEVLKNVDAIYGAINAEIKKQEELSDEVKRYTVFASSYEHVKKIVNHLNRIEGVNVLGGGKFEMIKDLGTVEEIDKKFNISEKKGTHGLAHVRFSTESCVDRYHAHPFQSYIYPEITVVHNGQITNCTAVRRRLAAKGHIFSTDNDTEVIVHYIADKLNDEYSLEEALAQSVKDMDGPFTYLIATANEIGIVKDKLALRPGILCETKEMFAAASEKVALESVAKNGPFEVLTKGEHRVFKIKK